MNFRRPLREYAKLEAAGFIVYVEKELQDDQSDDAKAALARLKDGLTETIRVLPTSSHSDLKKVPIFLLYGEKAKGGGRSSGMEYFQMSAPKFYQCLDERWQNATVIYCAHRYLLIPRSEALTGLIHELSHAFHLQNWPEEQPDILNAWKHAVNSGLYRQVRHYKGKIIGQGYALVNQMEYFAELSCMYFASCEYEPFDRKGLKAYDPTGYAMIQKLWKIP